MPAGDTTYTPDFTGAVNVVCCGASGPGRQSGAGVVGCGGGGGAAARKNSVPVTNGVGCLVRVGVKTDVSGNHESLFINNLTCLADFGTVPPFAGPGMGGQAAASFGDFTYNGGNGGPFPGGGPGTGTGGGARAYDGGAGGDGGAQAGGTNGAGEMAGDGGDIGLPGNAAPAGGGGGGGGGTDNQAGSSGADGYVLIYKDLGGGVDGPLVYSAGTLPPMPPPPFNPKSRKVAFIM